jgi:tRNA (adenine22-N1)-methyltransferase
MRLSKRIYKLADMVGAGESAADIGTDHGYVPMILVKNNISPRVIMSDISEGSLAKARETFKITGLEADEKDFRIGDGLETIEAAEVDTVIIGGLGGLTIIDILDADISKSKSYKNLVLQPRKHSGELRHYLYTHGWDISEEVLAEEGKFQCEILKAGPTDEETREELYPKGDIRWKYPEDMVLENAELAGKRIAWKIGSIDEQIANLESSNKDNSKLIDELKSDKEYLKDLLSKTE